MNKIKNVCLIVAVALLLPLRAFGIGQDIPLAANEINTKACTLAAAPVGSNFALLRYLTTANGVTTHARIQGVTAKGAGNTLIPQGAPSVFATSLVISSTGNIAYSTGSTVYFSGDGAQSFTQMSFAAPPGGFYQYPAGKSNVAADHNTGKIIAAVMFGNAPTSQQATQFILGIFELFSSGATVKRYIQTSAAGSTSLRSEVLATSTADSVVILSIGPAFQPSGTGNAVGNVPALYNYYPETGGNPDRMETVPISAAGPSFAHNFNNIGTPLSWYMTGFDEGIVLMFPTATTGPNGNSLTNNRSIAVLRKNANGYFYGNVNAGSPDQYIDLTQLPHTKLTDFANRVGSDSGYNIVGAQVQWNSPAAGQEEVHLYGASPNDRQLYGGYIGHDVYFKKIYPALGNQGGNFHQSQLVTDFYSGLTNLNDPLAIEAGGASHIPFATSMSVLNATLTSFSAGIFSHTLNAGLGYCAIDVGF